MQSFNVLKNGKQRIFTRMPYCTSKSLLPLNHSLSVDLMSVLAGCGQTAVLGCLYL